MKESPNWMMPKWPFFLANGLLIVVAAIVVCTVQRPLSHSIVCIWVGCVVLGALLSCLPFILDYLAICKLIEVNALTTVSDQLQNLEKYSTQISAATDRWAMVQETTKGNTDKTVAAAKEIADRMTDEIQEFNEFQMKLNDTEKAALRLEVEKLR